MQLEQITEIYTEERDCGAESSLPEYNTLKLASVSNGMGNYIVISTERWAVDTDNLNELYSTISALLSKANNK